MPPTPKPGGCSDVPGTTCLASKGTWTQYTCEFAQAWCDDPHWGQDARECCPLTCDACSDKPFAQFCSSWGDPHVVPFGDGLPYNPQFEGVFSLFKYRSLEVKVKQEMHASARGLQQGRDHFSQR